MDDVFEKTTVEDLLEIERHKGIRLVSVEGIARGILYRRKPPLFLNAIFCGILESLDERDLYINLGLMNEGMRKGDYGELKEKYAQAVEFSGDLEFFGWNSPERIVSLLKSSSETEKQIELFGIYLPPVSTLHVGGARFANLRVGYVLNE